MSISLDEPSSVCSDAPHRRRLDSVGRRFRLSAKLKSYETWLLFCFVYVPVIPLLSAAILGGYLYVRSHRAVYFVNGLPVPVVVDVDGRHSISLAPHAYSRLSMPEGSHHAVITEPKLGIEPVDFRIGVVGSSGLLSAPTFIVDPTRSAILVWEEAGCVAPKGGRPEAESRAHLGAPFLAYPHVDYAFEPFPKGAETQSPGQLRKTRISLVAAPAEKLVQAILASSDRSGDTLSLIENHLRVVPDDVLLLSGYWAVARRRNELERCRQFLSTRLNERPVLVDWHRLYQTISQDLGDSESLVEQYGALLGADPGDSALLYLRGRCDPDRETEMQFYKRAIAADPANAYPLFAESAIFLSRGDFDQAESTARVACRLHPDNSLMKRQFTRARMALRQYNELEAELRLALIDRPASTDEQELLLAVLVAAGKSEQAREAVKMLCQTGSAATEQAAPECGSRLRNLLLYLEGDFQGLLAAAAPPADTDGSILPRYRAQFELGQQIKPPAGVKPIAADHNGYSLLCQALAYAELGDAAAAAEARAQAIEQFAAGRHDDRRAADILSKHEPWDEQDIDALPLDPMQKCILMVAMAERSADRAAALLDLAEKLNFERRFPYHFLKRTIARLRQRGATSVGN